MKIKCGTCEGSGLEEREPKVCGNCKGKICHLCQNKGGYKVQLYEVCRNCGGDGNFTHSEILLSHQVHLSR